MHTHHRIIHHILRLILLYFVAGHCYAAMYKWVDEEGNTHYSEKPPVEDVEVKTIKPPPKVDTERALKELGERKKWINETDEGKAKQAEEQADVDKKASTQKANCDLARNKLARVNANPRVYSGEGEDRRRIGEEERQAKIAEANKMVKEFCK